MPRWQYRSDRGRRGQTTVEYALVISVLTVAMWAAAQLVVPGLQSGLESMTGDVQGMAEQGYVGGS